MIQHNQTKKRLTPEFRLEVIEQVISYQQPPVDVACAPDSDPSSLCKWILQYKMEIRCVMPVGTALTQQERHLQELEKQVRCLRLKKEILRLTGEISQKSVRYSPG